MAFRAARGFLFLILLSAVSAQPDALALKSRKVRELMQAGRFAEAVPLCAELVRAVPNNPGLLLNLGLAQRMSGQIAQSVPQFQAALKLDPGLFPALVSLGASYLDLGQPAKAASPLEKALSLQPANTELRFMLASALLGADRFEPATRHLRALSDSQPGEARVWFALGKAYEGAAQQAFSGLDRTAQGSAPWLALAADTRLSEGQYASAFALYREALAKDPARRGLHAGVAEVYRRTGHPDWAAAEEKKEPRAPDCARPSRECAFRAGRLLEAAAPAQAPGSEIRYWQVRAFNELARQAFAKLSALPPSAEVHRLKAQMETGNRRYVEAAKELREALKLSPGDRDVAVELAAALYQAHDYEAARATLAPLLKEAPQSPALNFMYGDALLRQEKADQAVPYLETAVRADSSQLQARAALGLAYARTGQSAKALPHLKAAAGLDTDGSLHYQLSRAYQEAGQPEAAAAALKKYRELQQQQPSDSESPAIAPPQ